MQDGFTVILVERGEGVETKPIKTAYSSAAGTAYVTFDKVKVPVENTLGEEGGGIFVMLRFEFETIPRLGQGLTDHPTATSTTSDGSCAVVLLEVKDYS